MRTICKLEQLLAVTALLFAPLTALAVPIAAPVHGSFYSMQFRGISLGATGETVGLHFYDNTDDTSAYGTLTVTDLTTSNVLYSFTGGNYGTYGSPGTFDTTFLLPYGDLLKYDMSGQEYSNMQIYYGTTQVASGGYYTSGGHTAVYPTYSTTETIPEPATLALLGLGLAGLGFSRRKKA